MFIKNEESLTSIELLFQKKNEIYGVRSTIKNEDLLRRKKYLEYKNLTASEKKEIEELKKERNTREQIKKIIRAKISPKDLIEVEEIREKLILFNIGLVKDRMKKRKTKQHEEEEFVGAGLQGLTEAIEVYDKEKGSFSTVASIWIDKELLRERTFINSKVYKPVYFENLLVSWKKSRRDGTTIEEFVDRIIAKEQVNYDRKNLIENILTYERETFYTEVMMKDGEKSDIFESIESEDNVEKNLNKKINKEIEEKVEEIIMERFGDRNGAMMIKRLRGETLESIAKEFGISRERVRQIVRKDTIILKKIKEIEDLGEGVTE